MTEEVGVVRRIVWRDILPWLIIFRAFRISVSLPILSLATVGWLLTPIGTQIASSLFLGNDDIVATGGTTPVNDFISESELLQMIPGISTFTSASNPISHVYQHFTDPFVQLFSRSNSIRESAFHLFRGAWSVAIWAFFAGAITRIATVQLGREERVDLRSAITYATRQYGWSFVAPFFPLFGVLLASLPLVALGFLMRAEVGMVFAGIVWPFALLGGLAMATLLLGLLAGWPLMWPTISSEEHGDAFEAFSRSFSYIFQRPLQYIFYLLLAGLIGSIGWVLVSHLSEAVIELTYFGTSWGATNDRIELVPFGDYTGMLGTGVKLIRMFEGLVRTVAMAFHFSYFFCVLTAIYLVLRRDVDKTDFDEVFIEDDKPSYSLPPLESNEAASSAVRSETEEAGDDSRVSEDRGEDADGG
ncbi:MAG: hypothetical protein H6822_31340 [Planctomycetaceae bacterium]|nr:hypothetical protein [Planctomycetales bacterium]MCB9926675.1 hypothetical protein [Planctomycetaceae bacterium]